MTTASMDPSDLPAALRTVIEADAAEAEMQGNMTTRVCTALRDAGAFRFLTPVEFGGWETPLTTVLNIYEAFGRIDASVGALVWNLNMGFVAALLPDTGARRIFTGTHEPLLANSGTPAPPSVSVADTDSADGGRSSAGSISRTGCFWW